MTNLVQRLLTKSEALGLRDEINDDATNVRAKLLLFRDGEGWRALDYKTWDLCVEAEFVFSRRHANRQLVAAQIEQRLGPIGLTSNGNNCSQFLLPESHARELACVPVDRQLEVYQRALQTSPNGLTAKHIAKTIAALGIRKTKSIFDDEVSGPTMRRHQSSGVVQTPVEFHSAIEGRFEAVAMDLAATRKNAVVERFISPKQNSFKQNWTKLLRGGMGYLNPPFDPVGPWAEKAATEAEAGARFVVLCKASIDTDWFWRMFPGAAVYALSPRIKFVGHNTGFPHPMILCAFNLVGHGVAKREVGRITRWHWQRENDQRLVRSF
jgi:phage N-6-adenine-methyltransferase